MLHPRTPHHGNCWQVIAAAVLVMHVQAAATTTPCPTTPGSSDTTASPLMSNVTRSSAVAVKNTPTHSPVTHSATHSAQPATLTPSRAPGTQPLFPSTDTQLAATHSTQTRAQPATPPGTQYATHSTPERAQPACFPDTGMRGGVVTCIDDPARTVVPAFAAAVAGVVVQLYLDGNGITAVHAKVCLKDTCIYIISRPTCSDHEALTPVPSACLWPSMWVRIARCLRWWRNSA